MNMELWLGLTSGIVFGFLLQKGRVLRFEKQIGALLLKDMTILKFMLSAILVGMAGILLLNNLDVLPLNHKPMNLGAVIPGGILFGAGWAIMGYCPGTSVGALGEGRWHAVFAIVGMIAGAALYAELYPFLESTVLDWKDFGSISLPETINLPVWLVAGVLWAVTLLLFFWFERKGL